MLKLRVRKMRIMPHMATQPETPAAMMPAIIGCNQPVGNAVANQFDQREQHCATDDGNAHQKTDPRGCIARKTKLSCGGNGDAGARRAWVKSQHLRQTNKQCILARERVYIARSLLTIGPQKQQTKKHQRNSDENGCSQFVGYPLLADCARDTSGDCRRHKEPRALAHLLIGTLSVKQQCEYPRARNQ